MKIKDGFEIKKVSDRYVIVSSLEKNTLQNTIVLTETSVFLWNLLKSGNVTKTQMLNAVIENFDISTVLALGDIDIFIKTMKENDIIEE